MSDADRAANPTTAPPSGQAGELTGERLTGFDRLVAAIAADKGDKPPARPESATGAGDGLTSERVAALLAWCDTADSIGTLPDRPHVIHNEPLTWGELRALLNAHDALATERAKCRTVDAEEMVRLQEATVATLRAELQRAQADLATAGDRYERLGALYSEALTEQGRQYQRAETAERKLERANALLAKLDAAVVLDCTCPPNSCKPCLACQVTVHLRGDITAHLRGDAPAQQATRQPAVVCLCGSSRFVAEHAAAAMAETLAGRIVVGMGLFGHADHPPGAKAATNDGDEATAVKAQLDALHLRKIDLADEVLVLNVGGYIGSSTAREIAYAEAHGKRVRYLEPAVEAARDDEEAR